MQTRRRVATWPTERNASQLAADAAAVELTIVDGPLSLPKLSRLTRYSETVLREAMEADDRFEPAVGGYQLRA